MTNNLITTLKNSKKISHFCLAVAAAVVTTIATSAGAAAIPQAPAGTTNLALGKKVSFAPKTFKSTSKGGTDSTDLTDGKTAQKGNELWKYQSSVTWYEAGQVNLGIDLGKMCDINEVAMRFAVKSKGGTSLPGRMAVMVSDDGKHYRKVAEFSNFKKGEFKKYDIAVGHQGTYIDCLRFKNLNVTARYVGIQMYGSLHTSSDELYVFGKPVSVNKNISNNSANENIGVPTGFTLKHAEVYFHKPYLKLATNIALPVPVGMITPDGKDMKKPVILNIDVPEGIDLLAGRIDRTTVQKAKTKSLDNGCTRYTFPITRVKTSKNIGYHTYGRLFFQAKGWQNGQRGKLHYSFSQDGWNSGELTIPIYAVTVAKAPQLKKIMAGMGWWMMRSNLYWPDVFKVYRTIGLNTFNMFNFYLRDKYPNGRTWKMLEKARGKGFKISMIAMPQHHQLRALYKKEPEVYHQYKDGKTSMPWRICMSYRGKYYHKMLEFYARSVARIQPQFSSEDIEPWYRGARASIYERCLRCQASFKKSGFSSWDKWLVAQGNEMWTDMIQATRKKLKKENINIDFKTGLYGAKYSEPYQNVWSVKYLYPNWMNSSQPSYYSPLFPQDLVNIGNKVRKDRLALGKSDVMPWLTIGDAGVFPGRALKWALLECYANGSRGVWFWSNRIWDSEDLIAYNKVIRAIAPVEEIIVDGQLIGYTAKIIGAGQISGMKLNGKMALLVSDYFEKTDGKVKLTINVPKDSAIIDLLNDGKQIGTLKAGTQKLTINLNGKKARFLEIKPAS